MTSVLPITKNKVPLISFIIVSVVSWVITGFVALISFTLFPLIIFFYGIAILIIGFPAFLKARKATGPSLSVYLFIFSSGVILSIIGTLVAYFILRNKNLI